MESGHAPTVGGLLPFERAGSVIRQVAWRSDRVDDPVGRSGLSGGVPEDDAFFHSGIAFVSYCADRGPVRAEDVLDTQGQ